MISDSGGESTDRQHNPSPEAGMAGPQYGTGQHDPACLGSCTDCLPPLPQRRHADPFNPALFRLAAPIATRPQDWAPRARAILQGRGAWRA